jgi:tetratricopeptide (TPR) repeat protein
MVDSLFISYSRVQLNIANDLSKIQIRYCYFWIDQHDIPGTADWWNEICKGIEECYCFIALLSQAYLDSPFCMGELEYALRLGKPIQVFMLEKVQYPNMLNNKRIQYDDVSERAIDKSDLSETLRVVQRDYSDRTYVHDLSQRPHLRPTVPQPQPPLTQSKGLLLSEIIKECYRKNNKHEYEDVIKLLEPWKARASGQNLRDIEELIEEANQGIEYELVAVMILETAQNRNKGCRRYKEFQKNYPDFPDYKELEKHCSSAPPQPPERSIPDDPQVLFDNGVKCLEEGYYRDAIKNFDQILKTHPNDVMILFHLALGFHWLAAQEQNPNYFEEARNYYVKVAEFDANFSNIANYIKRARRKEPPA